MRWWRSPESPEVFFYIDDRVHPEADPTGRPAVTLLLAGTRGTLQLGSRWAPPDAEIASLKGRIASEHPDVDPAQIRLVPAQATVRGARLETGGRAPKVLATSQTSGYAPHSAVFRADVEGDDLAAVTAALGGSSGRVFVRYDVALEEPARCEAVLTGTVEGAARPKDVAAAEGLVRRAIEQRTLVLSVVGEDELARREVEERVVRQAALALLADKASGSNAPRQIEARAEETTSRQTTLLCEGDVGEWFAGRRGTDHIVGVPGGGP